MNVIVIVSDSMRRDHLPCYQTMVLPPDEALGEPYAIYAPHLTALGCQSFVFDNAYLASFPTVPNRNDVMTGRYTYTYKGWDALGEKEVVLSETLNQAGVVTALFADTPHPFKPGFNYQRGFQAWDVIRGQENDPWKTTHRKVHLPADPQKFRGQERAITRYLSNVAERQYEEDYFPARTIRAAEKWLEKNYKQPFFLYIDTFDPHEPWDPPEHYIRKYVSGYTGEATIYPRYAAASYLPAEELAYLRALYAGEVSLVDHWIGNLLQRVNDLGLYDDTMVIFTADHGFYLGEHGSIGKSFMAPGYQHGLVFYPELARIPLLIRVPGYTSAQRIDSYVQPVDLMPTILDYFGVDIPQTVQGHSLMPLIRSEETRVRHVSVSSANISGPLIQTPNPTHRLTVAAGEWMLVFGSQAGISNDIRLSPTLPELYHLPQDPVCTRNVITDHFEIAQQMHQELLSFLREAGVEPRHLACFDSFPSPGHWAAATGDEE